MGFADTRETKRVIEKDAAMNLDRMIDALTWAAIAGSAGTIAWVIWTTPAAAQAHDMSDPTPPIVGTHSGDKSCVWTPPLGY